RDRGEPANAAIDADRALRGHSAAMSRLDRILSALGDHSAQVEEVAVVRANEVHCTVSPRRIKHLGDVVCRDLGAELITMLADDRRRTAKAFFAHYVFAHRTENWF